MSFSKAKSRIATTYMEEGISYSIDPYIFPWEPRQEGLPCYSMALS